MSDGSGFAGLLIITVIICFTVSNCEDRSVACVKAGGEWQPVDPILKAYCKSKATP